MASSLARYQIIDEPRSKPWAERFIIDPTIILFAAILVPLFWDPPLLGRFWIPAVLLIANGFALGSSTLRREIVTIVVGGLVWIALPALVAQVLNGSATSLTREDVFPYVRLLLFGIFFLTLYLVVFYQSTSYALYKYSRGED